MPITKAHITIAVVALITYAAVALIQQKVMAVPVVGGFLPR